VFKSISKEKPGYLCLALVEEMLRHTLVYFLVGCTSAEPTSAFASIAKVNNVNGIKD
jgi:hypothetical protein